MGQNCCFSRLLRKLIVITIIGLAIVLTAGSVLRAHLQAKTERRREEVALEEKKAFLDAQRFMAEQDVRRMEILLRAKQAAPLLNDVEELAADGRQALLKGMAVNGGGRLQGIDMSPELASELTKTARQAAREDLIEGVFDVLTVDTTFNDGFRVRLQNIENGEEFFAVLLDRMTSERQYEAVQLAEWNKRPIRLRLKVRRLRGKIVDAVVLDAVSAPSQASGGQGQASGGEGQAQA